MKPDTLNIEAKSEIRRLMRDAGFSRADLARALRVSRASVTDMLSPTRNLSLDTVENVVRTMGYTVHLCCHENHSRESG